MQNKTNVVSFADLAKAKASANLRDLYGAVDLEKAKVLAGQKDLHLAYESLALAQAEVDKQALRMDVVFLSVICTHKDRIELAVVGEHGETLLSLDFNPDAIDALCAAVRGKKVVTYDVTTDLLNIKEVCKSVQPLKYVRIPNLSALAQAKKLRKTYLGLLVA